MTAKKKKTDSNCGAAGPLQPVVMNRLFARAKENELILTEKDALEMFLLLDDWGTMTCSPIEDADLLFEYHCRIHDEECFIRLVSIDEIADWKERMMNQIDS